MSEAERLKRLQEEGKKNAMNGDIGKLINFMPFVCQVQDLSEKETFMMKSLNLCWSFECAETVFGEY